MARCAKITTGTGAVTAALIANGSASIFYGVYATSAEAAAYYIKLYWEGTGTPPPATFGASQPATNAPVPGTTIPSLTMQVPTTGASLAIPEALNNGGRIWFWVTTGAADANTTALTAGGDVISFVFD